MFGFPQEIHHTFNKNFLRTVLFEFNYQDISDKLNLSIDEIQKIFKENTLLNFEQKEVSSIEFSVNSKDNTIQSKKDKNEIFIELSNLKKTELIKITNKSISYIVTGSEYNSFKEILEQRLKYIYIIIKEIFKLEKINIISFRKLNVIEINMNDEFSSELTYNIYNDFIEQTKLNVPNKKLVLKNITSLSMKNEELNSQLNLNYGINSANNQPGSINHILIDININLYSF